MKHWNTSQIPDLTGTTVLVTGGGSGIGFEVSKELALRGAEVIIAGRKQRDNRKLDNLLANCQVTYIELDLADLVKIKETITHLSNTFSQIDILINNAGVMEPPYSLTAQGFEFQFGVNHIGHYALTIGLLHAFHMLNRVVTVTSLTALNAELDFTTMKSHDGYDKSRSYAQSKLSNLIFSLELNEYSKLKGRNTVSLCAHPGYARTQLQRHVNGILRKTLVAMNQLLKAQSARSGALPVLYAAVDSSVDPNRYYVPGNGTQLSGSPIKAHHPALNIDPSIRSKLMTYTATETGLELS